MKTETTIHGLAASLNPARHAKKLIGFVPTMGNLHEGHLNLVREAKKICDLVVVSIFVNPTQFGPNEDFDNYPRTLDQDSHLLADVGCDIVFAPAVEQMFAKEPRKTNIQVTEITQGLCGHARPGHFDGVALIVTKLFNIVQPNYAFFGQKDFQQLVIVQQLVRDLNMPLEVIGVPTTRAEDGLALSSRNGYLTVEERALAPQIYASLNHAKVFLEQGEALKDILEKMKNDLTTSGFEIDYVEARTPELETVLHFDQDIVLFVAARLGKTRLIDNLRVNVPT
ncbi:pantothenate synthetase [Acinetobacter nectaris CIP 110549]|uniref:Pantothenate synthetase n=1 Tax=Acinetobacter nectaris CIP 110549 TaxID=1392540 RepID=V2TRR1_9GAMM|nr:pantoate--beta-alanine ligase [Acinetobacter nectaris]ESK40711.1 pantothenate synthetase [Acinetobacter nectaris CIP 110549]